MSVLEEQLELSRSSDNMLSGRTRSGIVKRCGVPGRSWLGYLGYALTLRPSATGRARMTAAHVCSCRGFSKTAGIDDIAVKVTWCYDH